MEDDLKVKPHWDQMMGTYMGFHHNLRIEFAPADSANLLAQKLRLQAPFGPPVGLDQGVYSLCFCR